MASIFSAGSPGDVTLAGDSLSFTKTANSDHGALVAFKFQTGKYYVETQVGAGAGTSGYVLGVGNGFLTASQYPGSDSNSYGLVDGGDIRFNNANLGSSGRCGVVSNNGRQRMAVDADNSLVWFANDNGLWNGSSTANPATGVGGIDISGIRGVGADLYISASAYFTTCTVILRSASSSFSYAAPSGFSELAYGTNNVIFAYESPDTTAATGYVQVYATLNLTEAPDIASVAGFPAISASFALAETPDITSVLGYLGFVLEVTGTATASDMPDNTAINITVAPQVFGQANLIDSPTFTPVS